MVFRTNQIANLRSVAMEMERDEKIEEKYNYRMEACRKCQFVNHVTKYTYFCLKCGYYFRSDTNIPNIEDEIKRKLAAEFAAAQEKLRLKKIKL